MKAGEKEMRQLHDRDVMKPLHKNYLTPEQQGEALAYLMCRRPEAKGLHHERSLNSTHGKHGGRIPDRSN